LDSELSANILKKAALDVRLLIAHIARNGKALEQDDFVCLMSATDKIKSSPGPLPVEDEAKFWKVYSALVTLAEPARIDSLYIEDYVNSLGGVADDPKKAILTGIEKHQTTLRKIGRLSLFSFVLTLVLLAYLSITESLITRNEMLGREYQLLRQGVYQGTSIEDLVKIVQRGASTQTTPRPEGGGSVEGDRQLQISTNDAAVAGLVMARRREIQELASVNDRLLFWLTFGLAPGNKDAVVASPYNVARISIQRNINAVLSGYLLPTIAAILGVTVFFMRAASTRIQQLSFRSNDASVYWHRLILGVVGGIAISWFTVTDKTGVLSSIAPGALAFLVGYSVEVLYNILDSLVKALGGAKE
jgi:hypothetical protein